MQTTTLTRNLLFVLAVHAPAGPGVVAQNPDAGDDSRAVTRPTRIGLAGFTTTKVQGGAGFLVMNGACRDELTGSRMCTSEEVIGTFVIPDLGTSGASRAWVREVFKPGERPTEASGVNPFSTGFTCAGRSSNLPADEGLAVNRNGSFAGESCSESLSVACCAPHSGGAIPFENETRGELRAIRLAGFTNDTVRGDRGVLSMSETCRREMPGTRLCNSLEVISSERPVAGGGTTEAWVHPTFTHGGNTNDVSGAVGGSANLPHQYTCNGWNATTWFRGLTVSRSGQFARSPCDERRSVACCGPLAASSTRATSRRGSDDSGTGARDGRQRDERRGDRKRR